MPIPFLRVENGKILLVEQLRQDFVERSRVVVFPSYILIEILGIFFSLDVSLMLTTIELTQSVGSVTDDLVGQDLVEFGFLERHDVYWNSTWSMNHRCCNLPILSKQLP